MNDNTLSHAGIKGMKWYQRRWQNEDGSLTPEGKKRYAKNKDERDDVEETHADHKKARKDVRTMSDKELNEAINRIRNEETYAELTARPPSPMAKFAKELVVSTGKELAKEYAKKYAKVGIDKIIEKATGKKNATSEFEELVDKKYNEKIIEKTAEKRANDYIKKQEDK